MKIGFDVISDLNLAPGAEFNWEGKATSLYCIVAGNVSPDLKTIHQTLAHLGKFYQGVFYTLGSLEYDGVTDVEGRTKELFKLCESIRNLALLHHHVVVVDGIAIAGANGWYGNTVPSDMVTELKTEELRHEDIIYLKSTIDRLQKHLDVRKIVVVSNSVPDEKLYFGEIPPVVKGQLPLSIALETDTENKVTHWVYGTYGKVVDTTIDGINYINNACYNRSPYWAKRLEI
jgi:hypothetical protein